MTEAIAGGPDAFLESLREELSPCAHSHHVSFAAILAERRLALFGEYVDWKPRLGRGASPLQIVEALWDHACELAITPDPRDGFEADSAEEQFLTNYRQISPDQFGEFEADLSDLGALVDPDRFAAFRSYRGIWLLKLAMRCCSPGAGIASVMEVAQASLHMSIGFGLYDDYYDNMQLRENWNIPDVQAEALLQSKLARTLRATPRIGRGAVEALRRDFVP
jgi:hypothetical protein